MFLFFNYKNALLAESRRRGRKEVQVDLCAVAAAQSTTRLQSSKEMDACFLAERDKHTCVGKSCYMATHLTIITIRTESKPRL